jgi:hypothetical protein
MIERLVNVLCGAGLELTYDQILDALWLSIYIPKQQSRPRPTDIPLEKGNLVHPPLPPVGTEPPKSKPPKITPTAPDVKKKEPEPGELFVPTPGPPDMRRMYASPVRVPASEALPGKRTINAALRPLKRTYPSTRTKVLDVQATVDQIANGGPAVAVVKPAPERWLEVSLVVDESSSMRVWRETAQEFARLLERHGSFRDVRPWYVNLDQESVKLYSEPGLPNSPRRLRHPKELIDPAARRLILILTDCVSPAWRNNAMFSALAQWGRRGPVALVQVLPERLWAGTALGDATTSFRSYYAGAPNSGLKDQDIGFDFAAALQENPASPPPPKPTPMPMPVVNLEGWSIAPWARLISNLGDSTAEGVTLRLPQDTIEQIGDGVPGAVPIPGKLPAAPRPVPAGVPTDPSPGPTARQRVDRFRSAASPSARELAGYLGLAPLCLPVMRLVQRAMMRIVRQVDLAEFLLSGLVYQLTPATQASRAEDIFYEFFPSVREILQASVRQADQLRVIREVSRLIEIQTGNTIDFAALLAGDESALGPQNTYPVGQKFAEIASSVVRRLKWSSPATPGAPANKPPDSALDKARAAAVAVVSADARVAGFFVTPWGHILVPGLDKPFGTVTVVLAGGSSVDATVLAWDDIAELALLQVAITSNEWLTLATADELDLEPIKAVPRDVTGVLVPLVPGNDSPLNWSGEIVGQDDSFIYAHVELPNPFVAAGSPLLNRLVQVEAVFRSTATKPGEYLCYPAAQVERFLNHALQEQIPPTYELSAIGARALSTGTELASVASASLLLGPAQASFGTYTRDGVQIESTRCRVSRTITDSGFLAHAWIDISRISVGERLNVERIRLKTRSEQPLSGSGWNLSVERFAIEGMTLDQFPFDISAPTLPPGPPYPPPPPPLSISHGHPSVTTTSTTLSLSGFGEIEILPPAITTGSYSRTCAMRVRLLDDQQIEIEFAVVIPSLITPGVNPVFTRIRVLVVGTGSYELPQPVQLAAQQAGAAVAKVGGILLTGGWPGVDYLAAEAFAQTLHLSGQQIDDSLVQVIAGESEADFKGGKIVRVARNPGGAESLRLADLLILIGGAGGTWEVFQSALSLGKPVLPFRNTGTDARHAAILLEVFGQLVPTQILQAEFGDASQAQQAGLALQSLLAGLDANILASQIDNRELLWVTNTILPLAASYLSKTDGYEGDAAKILLEFRSHGLSHETCQQFALALIGDPDPVWRCTAYLAIEARPETIAASVQALMENSEIELQFGLERRETRPLWRWLVSIESLLNVYQRSFSNKLGPKLNNIAGAIASTPGVDPGGECRSLIFKILEKLRSGPHERNMR